MLNAGVVSADVASTLGGDPTGTPAGSRPAWAVGHLLATCLAQVAALILSIMFPLAYEENEALLRFQESWGDPQGLSFQDWSA